jgi:hypothetical protein
MPCKTRKPVHPQRFLLRKLVKLLREADAKIVLEKRGGEHEMVLTIPQVTDKKTGAILEYEMVYRIGPVLPEPIPEHLKSLEAI